MRGSILALALVAAMIAAPAQCATVVKLEKASGYTDATESGAFGIKAYLERLGATLSPKLDLRITVLNIDMAGRDPLYRQIDQLRVMRGVTWPSIRLRYVLSRGGKVIASGEEQIDDTLYRMNASARSSADPLRYEKIMLRDWFDMRFRAYRRDGGR